MSLLAVPPATLAEAGRRTEIELLGSCHRLDVPLSVAIEDNGFSALAVFEIPYVDWGLDDPSTFVLRVVKAVEVTVVAEGRVVESNDIRAIDPS